MLSKYSSIIIFCFLGFIHSYNVLAQESKEIKNLKESLIKADPEDKVAILNKIGWEYRNTDLKLSLQYFNESRDMARTRKDEVGLAEALNMTGVIHRKLGNYNKAIDFFFESLKISEKLKDSIQIAYAFNNMGEVYTYQLDYNNSELYIKKALAIFQGLDDKKGIAYCYLRFGENLELQKQYRQALRYFLSCAEIRETLNDKRGLAVIYGNIGNLYFQMSDLDKALLYAQKSVKLYLENDKSGMAQSQNNLAKIYFQLGDIVLAEQHAQKGLDLGLEFNSKKIALESSLLLAEILAKQGKIQQAYDLQSQALLYKDSLFEEEANKTISNLRESYQSDKQDLEIKNLNDLRKIKEEDAQLKNTLLYVSLAALLLISVFLILLYRNLRHNKVITRQLEEQKEEVSGTAENLKKANSEISIQHEIIERKNKDLTSSINYARRIQEAMLPSAKMLENALPEHFVLFRPKDIVSGDFYWVVQKKYKTIVAVGDCTGHGIPGAFMSLIGNDLLNEIILGRNITEPDKILTELRRLVRTVLRQEETGNHDGMDITICAFDTFPEGYEELLGTPKLEFAGAENPLYYFVNGKLHEIKGSKTMIGGFNILEREHEFTKHTILLEKRMLPFTFYMFSDGYQDQFGKKGKFMKRRFRDILSEVHEEEMPLQKQLLEETIDEWKENHNQMDDILVLGVRIK
jgi:serine phosphatase RsbU (regulator of sigma subunit)